VPSIINKRYRSILNQYLKSIGETLDDHFTHHGEPNWNQFSKFLCNDVYPRVVPSTWGAYKQAFKKECTDPEALLRIERMVTNSDARRELSKKTVSKRMKRLNHRDLIKLDAEAMRTKSGYGSLTMKWLKASLLTGLRPHEWFFSKLIQDSKNNNATSLEVSNRKLNLTSHSDEHWEDRIIPLDHLQEEELESIRQWLSIVKKVDYDEEYSSLYGNCRRWLERANKRIFPRRKKHICLMSPRHQFIANLKLNGLTPTEIAYLVGHGNDARAFESYGRTKDGEKCKTPKPPKHVTFHKIHSTYNQHSNKKPTHNF